MQPERSTSRRPGLVAAGLLLLLCACEREERRFRELPAASTRGTGVTMSEVSAGALAPEGKLETKYEDNAFAISEGQRLYQQFNCAGCHGHGGGGTGPALMDSKWIYGSEPENIFSTIVEGRPNGMPSFRGKVTEQQVWQLVAYVRSMSGLVPKDAAPSRPDMMQAKTPDSMTPKQKPTSVPTPRP